MKEYKLEIGVFLAGAMVMVLELVGSRVLAPYVGNSILVWSSLIGIILGSLSVGYAWGGKIADKNPTEVGFAKIFFGAGLLTAFLVIAKSYVPDAVLSRGMSFEMQVIVLAFVLFAPPAVAFGMISPYAARLKMKDISTSGTTVGNLYALGTAGSIMGTFLAGFVLFVYIGHTGILVAISLISFICAILIHPALSRNASGAALIFLFALYGASHPSLGKVDVDTRYNRIILFEGLDPESGKSILSLTMDGIANIQSSMFTESDELVYPYTKFYRLGEHFRPELARALMLGGGGYSYPKDFLGTFENATLDVVEIDPEITALARAYFRLRDDPRLTISHEDGRVFLNRTTKKYDAIFIDVFNSFTPPYQLMTKEAVEQLYAHLENGGSVIANIIGSVLGEKGEFVRREYATYRSVFPSVALFPVRGPGGGILVQNVMLIAVKGDMPLQSSSSEFQEYLNHKWTGAVPAAPVYTDEWAPVEYDMVHVLN